MGTELEADLETRGNRITGTGEIAARESGREHHTRGGASGTSTWDSSVHGEGSQDPLVSHENGSMEQL